MKGDLLDAYLAEELEEEYRKTQIPDQEEPGSTSQEIGDPPFQRTRRSVKGDLLDAYLAEELEEEYRKTQIPDQEEERE